MRPIPAGQNEIGPSGALQNRLLSLRLRSRTCAYHLEPISICLNDLALCDSLNEENSRKARRRLPVELWDQAGECFDALDQARRPQNLEQYQLKRLTGDRKGQYSIRINQQYRITFEWDDGDVKNVKVEDYHD